VETTPAEVCSCSRSIFWRLLKFCSHISNKLFFVDLFSLLKMHTL
jgi:hypothetical protein